MQNEQKSPTLDEYDILTQDLTKLAPAPINYNPSEGWHNAKIVAIADAGTRVNTFTGKTDKMIQIQMAIEEKNDDGYNKSKIEKYKLSIHEKSRLYTQLLSPASLTGISNLSELLGKTLRIKIKQEAEYHNIVNVDESNVDVELAEGFSVPKFWLVDGEGNALNKRMATIPGVIKELKEQSDDFDRDANS